MSSPIFTNKALTKIAEFQLTEVQALDAYNNGKVEKWTNGVGFNAVKVYHGYEIGVAYFRDEKGVYRITSAWKRDRR